MPPSAIIRYHPTIHSHCADMSLKHKRIALCAKPQKFVVCRLPSVIRYPSSAIRHPPFAIRHPHPPIAQNV
jgi:hypothetical protein